MKCYYQVVIIYHKALGISRYYNFNEDKIDDRSFFIDDENKTTDFQEAKRAFKRILDKKDPMTEARLMRIKEYANGEIEEEIMTGYTIQNF